MNLSKSDDITAATPSKVISENLSGNRPSGYFESIDGLRGLACFWVLAHHAWFNGGQYEWPSFLLGNFVVRYPHDVPGYGFFGVDIFFGLSAFCLAYPLLTRSDRPFVWSDYLRRRVQRIVPLYYIAFFMFLAISFFGEKFHIPAIQNTGFLTVPPPKQIVLALLFLQMYLNPSFWTLCVEARWYLILPVLLYIFRKVRTVYFFLACSAISIFAFLFFASLRTHPAKWALSVLFFFGPLPIYLTTFALGIIFAAYAADRLKSPLLDLLIKKYSGWGLFGSLLSILVFRPGAGAAFDTSYVRLIIGASLTFFALSAAIYNTPIRKFLCWKPFTAMGIASYSIYLIHQPCIMLIYQLTKNANWSPPMQFFFYQFLVVAVVIAIGFAFYFAAERPFLMTFRKVNKAKPA